MLAWAGLLSLAALDHPHHPPYELSLEDRPGARRGIRRRDGVFAIAITLLVLEIAVPAGTEDDLLTALVDQWPSYLAYLVSFSTVGAIRLKHTVITQHLERAQPRR